MAGRPLPRLLFEQFVQDDHDWEVVAAGRFGFGAAITDEVSAELCLARMDWRQQDPRHEPVVKIVRADSSWLTALVPGTVIRNGALSGQQKTSSEAQFIQRVINADAANGIGQQRGSLVFIEGTAKRAAKPAHPIAALGSVPLFAVRFEDNRLAYVPVFELLRAFFRLDGPWLRQMLDGPAASTMQNVRQIVDLSLGSHTVTDGILTCRCQLEPKGYGHQLAAALGDPHRFRAFTGVSRHLIQSGYRETATFINTMFPYAGAMRWYFDAENVRLIRANQKVGHPLLITRIYKIEGNLGVRAIRTIVPSRGAGSPDLPTRTTVREEEEATPMSGIVRLRPQTAPNRALSPRDIAVGEYPSSDIPLEVVVDDELPLAVNRKRVGENVPLFEAGATASAQGRRAAVVHVRARNREQRVGRGERMRSLIAALELAAETCGAQFQIEVPLAIYEAGDDLWAISNEQAQRLPSWARPLGEARRILVASIKDRSGVLYTLDAEHLARGDERATLFVWSPKGSLVPQQLAELIYLWLTANGGRLNPDTEPVDMGSLINWDLLSAGALRHRPEGTSVETVAEAILRLRERLSGNK